MNNLYELEYGIKIQKENLRKVDRTAWKVAKLKAKQLTRRHIKGLGTRIEALC